MGRLRALRREHLTGDRVLTVRPVDARDVGGLARLYAGLDDESRYRRFFSLHRPDRAFFERLAAVDDRGGAGIVAIVTGHHGGRGRIVGEAGYELLDNGDGELAITVDGAWRGWLGAYLLDVLTEVAAERGVPNLEAELLLANSSMLALVRGRGFATIPTDDWSAVRAVVSTARRREGAARPRPTWPVGAEGDDDGRGDGHLRVLVEGSGGRWHGQEEAAAAGLELLGCPGPASGVACPAVLGEPCPLVTGADVVVVAHPPDDEAWQALRTAHHEVHAGVPVCVELRAGTEVVPGEVEVPARGGAGGTGADRDRAVVRFVERLARRTRAG